jgi:hypothetical protein
VASPYPAGTFTRQEAPSFAWRTNLTIYPQPYAYLLLDNNHLIEKLF